MAKFNTFKFSKSDIADAPAAQQQQMRMHNKMCAHVDSTCLAPNSEITTVTLMLNSTFVDKDYTGADALFGNFSIGYLPEIKSGHVIKGPMIALDMNIDRMYYALKEQADIDTVEEDISGRKYSFYAVSLPSVVYNGAQQYTHLFNTSKEYLKKEIEYELQYIAKRAAKQHEKAVEKIDNDVHFYSAYVTDAEYEMFYEHVRDNENYTADDQNVLLTNKQAFNTAYELYVLKHIKATITEELAAEIEELNYVENEYELVDKRKKVAKSIAEKLDALHATVSENEAFIDDIDADIKHLTTELTQYLS